MKKQWSAYSFLVVSGLLILIESVLIIRGSCAGDFWEHAAVVRELSRHPLHPGHPIIWSTLPHAFFSPYSLVVALFSRLTGLNAIQALQCFGGANLLLLVGSFYFFCRRVFNEHRNEIAATALVLILLFWGTTPPQWSGFFHLFSLNYVLPYPSTFALCIAFIVMGLLARPRQTGSRMLASALLLAVVMLTHIYTAVFLAAGIVALTFTYRRSLRSFALQCSAILLPAFLICLVWPYFDFIRLFTEPNTDFHLISKMLYKRIPGVYWPFVCAIPSLYFIRKDRALLFLWRLVILMAAIYAAGYISRQYGVSRIVSPLMLTGHVITAYTVVRILTCPSGMAGKVYVSALVCLLAVSIGRNQVSFASLARRLTGAEQRSYMRYAFLRKAVGPDDIVLSDAWTNFYIPAFSGKVLSFPQPLFLFSDRQERKTMVSSFFQPGTPDSVQAAILKKFQPDFILIDAQQVKLPAASVSRLTQLGQVTYEADSFTLIRVNK